MAGLCEGVNEPAGSLTAICDNAGEMSQGSSTENYPAFARIGLRENPGKNLNQVTCPDRDSNPGHLASQPDALTVTPQAIQRQMLELITGLKNGHVGFLQMSRNQALFVRGEKNREKRNAGHGKYEQSNPRRAHVTSICPLSLKSCLQFRMVAEEQ
ncbi:hypothetical protein ANN_00565 [Periplaneta americana]|uniref:Uncharacterized protein n=1 Tax=Periplaneta americana TaxID=6978 RepID=A0ABQ8TR53_PERAM|nr:hypothetical protein ANN_00565 [Periplaneta americana]